MDNTVDPQFKCHCSKILKEVLKNVQLLPKYFLTYSSPMCS